MSLRTTICICLNLLLLWGCGRSGQDSDIDSSSPCCDVFENIVGAITNTTGDTSMEGWVLVMLERDTGTARTATVGAGGLFQFQKVKSSAAQTLVLLSDAYITKAVLSLPSETEGSIKSFFRLNKRFIGNIIRDGTKLSIETLENITIEDDLAKDAAKDGFPDGVNQIGGDTSTTGDTPELVNDPSGIDTDFDGLPNVFDLDDDNDGIYDVIDEDANGDEIADRDQDIGDLHFSEGVSWIGAQYESMPKTSGSKAFVTFTAKLAGDLTPFAVQIQGPARFIEGANYQAYDNTGTLTEAAWNRRLADDGESQDELPGDNIYAQKIVLPSSALKPIANEVFFIDLLFGSEDSPWSYSYPVSFPQLTVGTITASFDEDTSTVTFGGKPFGTVTDYQWTVSLYDEDDLLQWTSESLPASTKTHEIPAAQLVSGESYEIKVSARLTDRIRSGPAYLVHSRATSVTIP